MIERWRPVILNIAVAALLGMSAYGIYGRALSAPFIYDDYVSIVLNSSLHPLWPLSGPLDPPRENPFSARPLVNLSAAVNYYFGQLQPAGYRGFNLVLHVASAMLLFWIVRQTLSIDRVSSTLGITNESAPTMLALATALLWTVHPLNTEAVCYVTQRTELMMSFFYLATLQVSLNYWQAEGKPCRHAWLALATAACLAGMASKEVMVSAPIAVLLFERTFLTDSFRSALRRSWPLYLGLASTWCLLINLVAQASRSESAGFHLDISPLAWWLTQCKVLLMYLWLALWPWPLSIHYDVPLLQSLSEAWIWVLPVALLIGATIVAVWRNRAIGFVGAWCLMILAPTSLIPIITEVAAERRMYLPLAALVVLWVLTVYQLAHYLLTRLTRNEQSSNLGWVEIASIAAPVIAIALVFGALSTRRLELYRDPVALWRDTLSQYPSSDVAHANLGFSLMQAGSYREAMDELKQALAINPASPEAHLNLGVLLNRENRFEESASHYSEAVRRYPDDSGYHNDYGYTLLRLRRFPEAVAQFKLAQAIEPSMRDAGFNLGLALTALGENQQALAQFQQLVDDNSGDAECQYCLGNALAGAGKRDEAVAHLREAVRVDPELSDGWNNLGSLELQMGHFVEAVADLERAVRLRPDSLAGHFNLSQAYAATDRLPEARASATKALEIARAAEQADTAAQIQAWLAKHSAPNDEGRRSDGAKPADN